MLNREGSNTSANMAISMMTWNANCALMLMWQMIVHY